MTSNYIIDAYAWIEYFKASKQGENAKPYIESPHAVTPAIVISMISRKLSQEMELGNETPEGRTKRLDFIRATSRIIDLDFETASEAGRIHQELQPKAKGWELADAIILCTARNLKGKVVTGDQHFRQIPETISIQKP